MIYKLLRVLVVISMVLGIVVLAQDQVAWAEPATEVEDSDKIEEVSSSFMKFGDGDKSGPGTVKPPRRWLWTCEDGFYSLGGVATLSVENLAHHYCLRAILWRRHWPPVYVPHDAGSFLADITFLRVFYRNRFKKQLPVEDGSVELCYAVPPGKEAKIYFLDFYGRRRGKPTWVALDTRVENGIACAPAQKSGAYALIGQ